MRIIAFLILVIPGILAGVGIKWMRDVFFGVLHAPIPWLSLQFFLGLAMMIGGIWFIAGFILHRDRKRGKVPPKTEQKSV
ncbi:uncharacterized protein DUF2627 [Salsuginibacillus halophilus]|uniref:Uncharacterized protein DUF2627 n=1 Tax=Salsuginibacillus halophilus TaxID=517424 RepID=A0A2P8HXZ8_9BACI|nr:DUF2627 domain-containing protein [Salsuginibacillus halophilus]PSL51100.1 uncharacterized protein DUF2627 [Salsuginibacillus halophilus]